MFILYDLVFILFAIIYLPYAIIKGKMHKGFLLRFGFLPDELKEKLHLKKNIWIHAVSVGEVMAVVGLIQKIKKMFPEHNIVLSTVTKTGNSVARSQLKDTVVIFAPFDFSLITKKFVSVIRPEIYITAETEIWPNIFLALNKKDIPIVQVNGRISDEAFSRYKKVRVLLKGILQCVTKFCMQTDTDAHRIIELGAQPKNIEVVGNIKFDNLSESKSYDFSELGFQGNETIWIAGSTHPGEEEIVLDIFNEIKEEFPDLRLIIVPRHVERSGEVENIVKSRGLFPILFSDKEKASLKQNSIMIVDKIGHLKAIYTISKVVFIGKSITAKGGQNIIEPASFGKPVIVGPHMQNFKSVVELLVKENAIIQVQDPGQMLKELKELLSDRQKMEIIGEKAKKVIISQQGATDKTANIISKLI